LQGLRFLQQFCWRFGSSRASILKRRGILFFETSVNNNPATKPSKIWTLEVFFLNAFSSIIMAVKLRDCDELVSWDMILGLNFVLT
jgi:hypothetical protein